MTKLARSDAKRVIDPVYYCEKHGILNKPADSRNKTSEIQKHPQWLRTD